MLPRRKHGDIASVTTGFREHPLGSIAACSAKTVWRIPYFIDVNGPVSNSVPARSKLPTSPRPRLYDLAVDAFPKPNYHCTGHALRTREVDVFQVLYIYMRRAPRAHPGSRERNRHQPQPYFVDAIRTGEEPCWWYSTMKRFRSGWGGGRLFNSASMRTPCAAPIIPLQGGIT